MDKVSPDIYGLSETWFREEVSDNLIDINDYSIYRNDRQVRTKYNLTKKGGGVCLYVKKGLKQSLMQATPNLEVSSPDCEMICVKIELPCTKLDPNLCCANLSTPRWMP